MNNLGSVSMQPAGESAIPKGEPKVLCTQKYCKMEQGGVSFFIFTGIGGGICMEKLSRVK